MSPRGYVHRRTSQEAGGLQPPDSGKAIIFRAKAKFFGQKPTARNENKTAELSHRRPRDAPNIWVL